MRFLLRSIQNVHLFYVATFLSSTLTNAFLLPTNNAQIGLGPSTALQGISSSQIAVLDGSCLSSFEKFLSLEGISLERPPLTTTEKPSKKLDKVERVAFCEIVVGTIDDGTYPKNQRIVGIATSAGSDEEEKSRSTLAMSKNDGSKLFLYKDSIASVPNDVNDAAAISTCIASLVGVHCAVHTPSSPLEGVGGSSDKFVPDTKGTDKKVIVVGGGQYASFIADAMDTIGAEVTQVSTNKLLRPRNQGKSVKVMTPDVGKMSLGFASVVGTFDAIVDTISDESKVGESRCIGDGDDWSNGNDADECKSAVIIELEKQHECKRYISTMNRSQRIVRDEGILFGRNAADQYVKLLASELTFTSTQQACKVIQPPRHFGIATLEPLLKSKILYKNYMPRSEVLLQGWSLKDYWELTSWPRDSTGGANVRFGFPVVDDLNNLFESEKDPPPKSVAKPAPKPPIDEFAGKENPYVTNIDTIKDLDTKILNPKVDSVLFLSTTYCRTCKYLTPKYTRIARAGKEDEKDDTVFAKANVGSKKGKMISRLLGVDAVPAFVLFQNGKRYGDTLSISKLPSKKLDLALEFMKSGKKWDRNTFTKEIDKL